MNRPKKRKPSKKDSPRAAHTTTTTLIVADLTLHKKEAEKKRLKYLKQLRTAQRSLERFEEKDITQFEQWKAAHFGKRLSELRELEEKARAIAQLINEVENEQFQSGQPYHICYQNILRWREHPEERPKPKTEPHKKSHSGNPMEDMAREMFESIFEDEGIEWDDIFGDDDDDFPFGKNNQDPFHDDTPQQPSAPRKANPPVESKKLYRQLARKLHPDHRDELPSFTSDRLDALWHETQTAYAEGNIEDLERIDALIDIEANGIGQQTDLERIQHAAEHHRRSLRAVERSIRQARKHPAWMFSKKAKTKKQELEPFIDFNIHETRDDLQFDINEMQRHVNLWKKTPKKRVRKVAKKVSKKPLKKTAKKTAKPKATSPKKQVPPQPNIDPHQEELFADLF